MTELNQAIPTEEQAALAANDKRIDFLKLAAERAEKFLELQQNPLFKELVMDMYIEEEPKRLVELIADPSCNTPDQQTSIQRRLAGVSCFQAFMRQYIQGGQTGSAEIAQLEAINVRLEAGELVEMILASLQD